MQQKSNLKETPVLGSSMSVLASHNSVQLFSEFQTFAFNFYKLLILRTIQLKFSEYLEWFFFQATDFTFVASEIKILFFYSAGSILNYLLHILLAKMFFLSSPVWKEIGML